MDGTGLQDSVRKIVEGMAPEQLRNLRDRLRPVASWKIAMFKMHPKQNLFHRSLAHTRLFQGGNRSGKTTSGVTEAIAFCLGYRPWLSKDDPRYLTPFKPPVKGRIVCEDFKETGAGVIVEKLKEWMPPDVLEGSPRRNQVGVETEWTFKNGSRFEIMTNEQVTKIFEGWSGHWAWFDEPPPRDKYIAMKRGLVDHNGYCWLTMTPLSEPWTYDELVCKAVVDPEIAYFEVDTYDNIGYGLTKEGVEAFEGILNEDEKEARIHGKHRSLIGLIYKAFNPGVHIIEPFPLSPTWPRFVFIDPHPRTPHAVQWLVRTPHEKLVVYDDLFHHCLIGELAEKIKAKNGPNRIMRYICDPLAFVEDPVSGKRWADEFVSNGLMVEPAVKSLITGIEKVQNMLKGSFNEPELYFFKTAERTIWEIQRYRWDDHKTNPDSKNKKETPVDKDDHMMENLYRACLMIGPYVEISGSEDDLAYPPCDVP